MNTQSTHKGVAGNALTIPMQTKGMYIIKVNDTHNVFRVAVR